MSKSMNLEVLLQVPICNMCVCNFKYCGMTCHAFRGI